MNGVTEKCDYVSLVEEQFKNLCQYADCSTDISEITSPERKILRKFADTPDEVS